MIRISVAQICDSLAALARRNRYQLLGTWLKLAANEAHLIKLSAEFDHPRIGAWDWDVSNNLNYVDSVCADFFGKKPDIGARGAPVESYFERVHEDDRGRLIGALYSATTTGADFASEYRVVANGVMRRVRAQGNCVVDSSGRPLRAMGSIVEMT